MTTSRDDPLGIRGMLIHEKYLVGDVAGEGGFSTVYKAEHTIWKQPVALKCFKVLANAPSDQRDQLLNGFIQEGKLMTALSSRSAAIVQARDVGTFTTNEGTWIPYMVLEWLDGRPLDYILKDEQSRRLPPRELHEAMALIEPAIIALDLVHARNIAHRDIKPANIFVMGDPRGVGVHVKVLDFGIAKVMADHAKLATALAQTGKEITAFTPSYGAPEQFSRVHGATGPWTDVFAMALILVELIRGKPALEGDDLIQLSVASRDPLKRPTPRHHGIPVTEAVEAVFQRALAVAPGERFPTMGEFWRALHHAVFPEMPMWNPTTGSGGGPVSMSSGEMSPRSGPFSGFTPRGMAPPPASVQVPPSVPGTNNGVSATALGGPPTGPSSNRGLVVGLLALGALAFGGAGAFFFLKDRGPTPPVASVAPPPLTSTAPASAPALPPRTTCPEGTALVPGGKFYMGSDDTTFPLWQPSHKVTLDSFCMDVTEVTAAAYKVCSDQGECKRPADTPDYPRSEGTTDEQHAKNKAAYAELCNFGKPGRESHPINCVSWDLADAYCRFLKKRLPTEAEWEYAARGSDGRKLPWGDAPGDEKHMNACGAECNRWEAAHGLKISATMYTADDGFPGTAPVESFPAGVTRFGLHDMIGNVWEWTGDWFATYKPGEVVNPKGAPAGDRKVMRGGGFNGGVQMWLDPAFRYHQLATASTPGLGFRCAADL
jgi:formylglycine-generating enzyme required for sulfatase activity